MTTNDRLRIASAVWRYDFWMDLRGVPGQRRRGLRDELRANLTEAARDEGTTAALLGIGSPRALAHDVAEAHASRPRWTFGAYLGLGTLVVLQLAWLLSVVGFISGVAASGVRGRTVTGSAAPWASEAQARFSPAGQVEVVSATVPLALWALAVLVFLIAAQPWRPLATRRRRRALRGAGTRH